MPFAGNEHEMLVMQSFSDANILQLTWCIPADANRFEKKSLELVANLMKHQGEGSIYQCLKTNNLISDMDFNLNPEIKLSFRYLTLEIQLTDHGLIEYERVLAIIFEYIKIVKDEWLAKDTLDFFREIQTISDLSYKIYNVPAQEEHVVALSEAMLLTTDPTRILEDVYAETIVRKIDQQDIKAFLGELTFEKCKIVLNGNDLLNRTDVKLPNKIRDMQRETFFNAKFRTHEKPADLKKHLNPDDCKGLTRPSKNKYVPENTEPITKIGNKKQVNPSPITHEFSKKFHLYCNVDQVYLKPLTSVNLLLRIR